MKLSNLRPGFTFLEVLLALSLFTVGMISVLQIFPVNRRFLSQSSMTTQAVYLVQEQIENLRGQTYTSLTVGAYEPPIAMGTSPGDVLNLFQRSTTIAYINPSANWVDSASDLGMKRLTVQVTWQEGASNRSYSLSTYVYQR